MNTEISSSTDSSSLSIIETSIITLTPCDYESSEEDDLVNSSQDSIDSSELVDDSDNEAEPITELFIINKKLEKVDENNDGKIGEIISV